MANFSFEFPLVPAEEGFAIGVLVALVADFAPPFVGALIVGAGTGGILSCTPDERDVSGDNGFRTRLAVAAGMVATWAVAGLLVLLSGIGWLVNDGAGGNWARIVNPRGALPSMEIVSKTFSLGFHLRGERRLGDAGDVVPFVFVVDPGFVPQLNPILSTILDCCGFVALLLALGGWVLPPLVDGRDGGFGL